MITWGFAILALWCLYNTIAINMNRRDDTRGEVLDKMMVRCLQLQSDRIDKLEDAIKDIDDMED